MDTDGRAVTRGRMHMCMWMLAQQYGEVVRPICVANEKSMRLALWSRPFAPRIEWPLEASAEASLCAAGDDLQVPLAGGRRRRSVGKQADIGRSAGFGEPLFSPSTARRDRVAYSLCAWFTGGCDFGWNVTFQLEVVTNGLTARLLDSRARLCRGNR